MLATYDLQTQPSTFDFTTWLVNAISRGATAVSFINLDKIQTKKYASDAARLRFSNILRELCAIVGLDVTLDDDRGFRCGYMIKDLPEKIRKLPYIRKHDHQTVTIRDSFRNYQRNSNRAAWTRFANEIGAILIDDADIKPIPLRERYDLYQCRMNWFVDNGPATLCYFSEAPYVSFKWMLTPYLQQQGMFEGYQFPWAHDKQRLVWKDDTYENIMSFATEHKIV